MAIVDTMWSTWTNTTTTTASTFDSSTNGIWITWATSDSTSDTSNERPIYYRSNYVPPQLSDEDIRRRQEQFEAQRQQALREAEARMEQAAAASARAKETLLSLLTEEQVEEYEKNQYFHLVAKNGKKYQIKKMIGTNILQFNEEGAAEEQWCSHFTSAYGQLPVEDILVAQLLYFLSGREEELRQVAHRSRVA